MAMVEEKVPKTEDAMVEANGRGFVDESKYVGMTDQGQESSAERKNKKIWRIGKVGFEW
jgi:hypothetical protein